MGAIRPGSGGGGGGASIPATPAEVLLDAASPNTILALDPAGIGVGVSVADMRTALGVTSDPGLPSSGLLADWRASALSLSDGDPVSAWAPSVGSPGSLENTGSARPTFRATGTPLGAPCVEFDGTNTSLRLLPPAGLPDGSDAATIVAIICGGRVQGTEGKQHVVHLGTAGYAATRGLALDYAGKGWTTHEWGMAAVSSDALPRDRQVCVLGHSYDGAVVSLYVDGVVHATGTLALATGTNELAVGNRVAGSSERGAFKLIRLAIYDHALTAAEWAQVMAHARAALGAR